MKKLIALFAVLVLSVAFLQCESPMLKGAKVYLVQENYPMAKEALLSAVDHNPNDAEARYLLGYVYGVDGDFVKMNEHFDKCKELSKKFDKKIADNIAKYYQEHRNGGANYFNQAISSEGENKAKLFNKSIDEFKIALLVKPNEAEIMTFIGNGYRMLEDFTNADEYYKKSLALDPNSFNANFGLGMNYYLASNEGKDAAKLKEATKYLEKAYELKPEDKNLVANLASMFTEAGNTEKAIEMYNKAIEKDPKNTDLMFNLSNIYLKMENLDKAFELWKKIEEINPEDKDVLYNIGSTLYEQKNFKDASVYYEKVVKLDPKNVDVWKLLGACYGQMGKKEKMKNAFNKVDELEKK